MTEKSPEIVVAGHICLDLIPRFITAPAAGQPIVIPGGLTLIGPAQVATGGAVSNTGLALHRLGVRAGLMGKVGDDPFGREVLRIIRSHGEHLSRGMCIVTGETTSYTVVISPPGVDRAFLHCPGANDNFAADDLNLDLVRSAKILHFGYPPIMRRLYLNDGSECARLLALAKSTGVTTSLDLCSIDPDSAAGRIDWRKFLSAVLPHVDLFQPSLDELLVMLDRPAPGSLADLRGIADEMIQLGAAAAAIKLGADGLYLRTTADPARWDRGGAALAALPAVEWVDSEVHAACFGAQVVSTIGSGDCTIAGLLAAILRSRSAEDAVTFAAAVGACSVEAIDATSGVPAWERVQQRIDKGWQRVPGRFG